MRPLCFSRGGYLLDRVLVFVPRRGNASAAPGRASNSAQTAAGNTSGFVAFSGRMADKLRDAGLARASAKLRAALNAAPRKGTRSYPSAEIESALTSFGPYQAEAFAILKEALDGTNLEARLQAIAALGRVGKDVPEAKALLWTLLKSGEPRACSLALTSLGNIGFASEVSPT